MTDSPALDDQGALSPDGARLAFRDLTGQTGIQGDPVKPGGFFGPSWSPDARWIAFSSDRNTEWKGHGNGSGWEHVQELGIYLVRPDGSGLRRITQPGISAGAPRWSADGRHVVFYVIAVEQTWDARTPFLAASATSQIVSVEIATGRRTEHSVGPGLKVMPQFLARDRVGYLIKAGPNQGLVYTGKKAGVGGKVRSPAWSPDGEKVIYEKVRFTPRPQNQLLYSWDPNYEYRYTDVFPSFSKDGKLVVIDKDSDSSISIMDADGSNKQRVFLAKAGVAFSPSWSPDGQTLVFGFGGFFQARESTPAKIMLGA